ncbi:hypothetical protein Ddc_14569 [Ditylenchus destructor]|nr:hypothetical protein Ddc_14569 [Ditylenchus destructor]
MNFTILVVALVLTQAIAVRGCTVTKVGGQDRLRCMNGNTSYGYLTYSEHEGEIFKKYHNVGVAEKYQYLRISVLQAFEGGEATITALLKYFIDHIAKANGYQHIKLSRGDDLAEGVFENEFHGKYKGDDMIWSIERTTESDTDPRYPTLHIILINGYIDGYMAINVKA